MVQSEVRKRCLHPTWFIYNDDFIYLYIYLSLFTWVAFILDRIFPRYVKWSTQSSNPRSPLFKIKALQFSSIERVVEEEGILRMSLLWRNCDLHSASRLSLFNVYFICINIERIPCPNRTKHDTAPSLALTITIEWTVCEKCVPHTDRQMFVELVVRSICPRTTLGFNHYILRVALTLGWQMSIFLEAMIHSSISEAGYEELLSTSAEKKGSTDFSLLIQSHGSWDFVRAGAQTGVWLCTWWGHVSGYMVCGWWVRNEHLTKTHRCTF